MALRCAGVLALLSLLLAVVTPSLAATPACPDDHFYDEQTDACVQVSPPCTAEGKRQARAGRV